MKTISLEINKEIRLDKLLKENFSEYSREILKSLITNDKVSVNGKIFNKSSKLVIGSLEIKVDFPNKLKDDILPWNNQSLINIKLETDNYMVIEKKSNLVVHPGINTNNKTLLNIIKYIRPEIFSNFINIRPIIVHRIDKYTSGLILISKTEKFSIHILKEFETRNVFKKYLAVVEGNLKNPQGMIDAPIRISRSNPKLREVGNFRGKEAVTIFREVEKYEGLSLVEFKIITGRTHQIRVHSKYIGNPILNDFSYGGKNVKEYEDFGYFLHSSEIEFSDLNGNRINVKSSTPVEFKEISINRYLL